MAISYLGAMSVDDFFQITPKELDDAIYYKNQAEESKLRDVFEVLRLQTYWDVNKYIKKGKKPIRKELLMQFPWDKSPKRRVQTAEEMKKMMKSIARSFNKGELKRRIGNRPARGNPDKNKKL